MCKYYKVKFYINGEEREATVEAIDSATAQDIVKAEYKDCYIFYVENIVNK